MLKKVAKKIEIRMNDSDKKYADLVASMEKYENHPVLRVKKEAGLAIAKAECKDVSCELSALKGAIGEKNRALRKLEAANQRWDAAQKVKDNLAANDVKRLVRGPKVSFDRFTDQTNAEFAKMLWLSKAAEAKTGSLIVS